MLNFGNAIKAYRTKEGLTQDQLAKKLGIEPTYLSVLERGRKDPSVALLKKTAKILDIAPEVIVWDAIEVDAEMSAQDRKIIEMAKVLVKHYFRAG